MASDRDGVGQDRIVPRPNVYGMYQPDAIAAYQLKGKTHLVTANEGDARDYDGFGEEVRAGSLPLDRAGLGLAQRRAAVARDQRDHEHHRRLAGRAGGLVHEVSTSTTQRGGDMQGMVTVSLLWIYLGCRASARALGAVQAVLPR